MPVVVERRQQLSGVDIGAAGALERWVDAAAWGLAIVDPQHRVVRANPALARMDGVPLDDHAGRPVEDVLPAFAPQLAEILRRVLEHGETVVAEELLGGTAADPEREHRWATSWFPMRGDDGTVQAAAGMLVRLPDVTESELDLRAREHRMHLAMEGTGTGFWEWEVAADRVRWTDGLAALHGLPAGTLPRGLAGLLELVHPADRAAVERALRAAIEEGAEFVAEYRTTGPAAGERWLAARGRALPGRDGPADLVAGLTADVTERRRREDTLTFLAEAGDALAGSLDPGADAERDRPPRGPPPRGLVRRAARIRRERRLRERRGRPRRPREGALGARSCRSATRPTPTRRPASRRSSAAAARSSTRRSTTSCCAPARSTPSTSRSSCSCG